MKVGCRFLKINDIDDYEYCAECPRNEKECKEFMDWGNRIFFEEE